MATYFMSLANENWSLCRYASDATFTTSYTFCGVSLLTMTAISVDRLLALFLGLKYRQTNCNFGTHIYHASCLLGFIKFNWFVLYFKLPYSPMAWPYKHITISANLNHLVHKDCSYSQSLSGWSTTSCPTTAEPTKCIKYGEIQKSGVQCTVGAVCIIVCYLTYFIIETLISQSNTYSLHLVVFWRLTIGLV